MSGITKRPAFWVAFAVLSAVSAMLAWRYFPEALPLINLDVKMSREQPLETAGTIAEARARADWAVDFGPYRILEQSRVERPNGRVDHAFVYEREDVKLGEARIRMRLTVSGDALSEVTYFVHVPEAFGRRFQEMRSANNAIARVASLVAGLLYGLGGWIIGVLWLLRPRRVVWEPALVGRG